jgi:hypothetical protein
VGCDVGAGWGSDRAGRADTTGAPDAIGVADSLVATVTLGVGDRDSGVVGVGAELGAGSGRRPTMTATPTIPASTITDAARSHTAPCRLSDCDVSTEDTRWVGITGSNAGSTTTFGAVDVAST